MSPRKPTPENDNQADERGIVYHGPGWSEGEGKDDEEAGEDENERGVVDHPATDEGAGDVERGDGDSDEEPTDPRNRDA